MIIKITQTESNTRQSYEIEGEDFYFSGNAGSISRLQTITLRNRETTIKGVYHLSKWVNYIPFRYLTGKANITRTFYLYRNDELYGTVVFSKHAFWGSFYVIALKGGEVFHCFDRYVDSFHYISIYRNETQIALIETYLNVTDLKFTHKLYLLDEYRQFADTFSFFTVYYAGYCFAHRFHMSSGSTYRKGRSITNYAYKYNPQWRAKHFPNENFFGKIDAFR